MRGGKGRLKSDDNMVKERTKTEPGGRKGQGKKNLQKKGYVAKKLGKLKLNQGNGLDSLSKSKGGEEKKMLFLIEGRKRARGGINGGVA